MNEQIIHIRTQGELMSPVCGKVDWHDDGIAMGEKAIKEFTNCPACLKIMGVTNG